MWCTDPDLITIREVRSKYNKIKAKMEEVDPEDLSPNLIGVMDMISLTLVNYYEDTPMYNSEKSDLFRSYSVLKKVYLDWIRGQKGYFGKD